MAQTPDHTEVRTDWLEYERRKQEWIAAHPEANHVEHQAALTRIAQECGV